jgi:1,2-diacylglycerol 3-alpha-glucosyltransferase
LNILMLTNTYLPQVGGVARSVASFTEAFRRRGHRVLVVAPTYEDMPEREQDVLRVPAIQRFNGSDFSLKLPVPVMLFPELEQFGPEVVHSHHPFLLGDTAIRLAARSNLPLVFTHHTMYEQYTHYVPGDSSAMKQFAIRMATEYANLCDQVIAPSESIADVLRERSVTTPIEPIPTGIDRERFAQGDGAGARRKYGIPPGAFVVGHVGRLAPEKNLAFLARAVAAFVEADDRAHVLIAGLGPALEDIRATFAERGLSDRLRLVGTLEGPELSDTYHAMNVFAFASQSETQGMVLAEAMAAGVPVIAVDAPGAREIVRDGHNGRLLAHEDEAAFAEVLRSIATFSQVQSRALSEAARATSESFGLDRCADRVLSLYDRLLRIERRPREAEENGWTQVLRLLDAEWNLWSGRLEAAAVSIRDAVTSMPHPLTDEP